MVNSCCICNPQLKPNPDLCAKHKNEAIFAALEANIRIAEAADAMYWDAKEKFMSLIRCCCCMEAKSHFTTVGDMGGYCDDCIYAGKLAFVGVTMPDVPGVPQQSRESIVPADLSPLSLGPHSS